jgi:hypothetical protein
VDNNMKKGVCDEWVSMGAGDRGGAGIHQGEDGGLITS